MLEVLEFGFNTSSAFTEEDICKDRINRVDLKMPLGFVKGLRRDCIKQHIRK